MAKLKFPKTLFVTVGSDPNNDEDEWFDAVASSKRIDISVGEEKEIAEYRFVGKKKFIGIAKEV